MWCWKMGFRNTERRQDDGIGAPGTAAEQHPERMKGKHAGQMAGTKVSTRGSSGKQ